jgi:peptide/nickel transport system permease protein
MGHFAKIGGRMIPVRYFIKRLITYVVTIFVAVTLTFVILRLPVILGGQSPLQSYMLQLQMTAQFSETQRKIVEAYITKFGLNEPLGTQYIMYLSNLLRGDMGVSLKWFPANVSTLIANTLPWTIGLLLVVILISWILGNVLGAIVGWRSERKKLNWTFASIAIVINQIPFYVLGLVLIMTFAYYIVIFPSSGSMSSLTVYQGISLQYIADLIYHATLPALSIILVSLGGTIMGMRTLMINIKGEDFIRYAQARGLTRNRILMRYAFRNTMLPQVTGLAMSIGGIFSGSLIVEWIFSYPGMGKLFVDAIKVPDYNVVQGVTLLTIIGVMTAVLFLDIIYPLIDPRISYAER